MIEDKSTGAPGNEKMKKLLTEWNAECDNWTTRPTMIKISEEFHFNGKGLWLGLERSPNIYDDLSSQFVKAHEDLVSAFKAISGQTMTDYYSGVPENQNYNREPPYDNTETERRVGLLADDILSSPDLKTLESYKLIVRAKPELQEAYDKRLKELS